jgi:hypothetical protein
MNYNIRPPTFTIETNRLNVGLETACLQCGRRFRLCAAAWTMRVGHECVGYFCSQCLTDEALQQLSAVGAKANIMTTDDEDR